jgi:integrase
MAGTFLLHSDETKSGGGRNVPLNKESLQMLVLLPQTGAYVFGGAKPLGCFGKAWTSACKRAGLPGLLVHGPRRSGIRNLRMSSVPREVIKNIIGPEDESVYRRYSIVDTADLKDAVNKLDRFLEHRPNTDESPDHEGR